MKKFRTSEIVFMSIGLGLMASSFFLLVNNISLVKFFNIHHAPGDPFQASYYSEPLTSPVKAATPAPTPIPTPVPVVSESTRLSLYLLSPLNRAVITHAKKSAGTHEKVLFKFEVYPKNSPVTFELLLKDQVIYSNSVPTSETVSREISVEIEKAGLYRWRVKAADITSEIRTFTLKN
jgi:hypothetical protein